MWEKLKEYWRQNQRAVSFAKVIEIVEADLAARGPMLAEVEQAFVAAEQRYWGGPIKLMFQLPAGMWAVVDNHGSYWSCCVGSELIPQLDALWPASDPPPSIPPEHVYRRDEPEPAGIDRIERELRANRKAAESRIASEPEPPSAARYGDHQWEIDTDGEPSTCHYCDQDYEGRTETCPENPLPEPKSADLPPFVQKGNTFANIMGSEPKHAEPHPLALGGVLYVGREVP